MTSSTSSSKVTYVSALTDVLASCELTDEVREKLEALKSSLEKRASKRSTKETKAQREAREFRETLFGAMQSNLTDPVVAGEIAAMMDVTVQKASAALRTLVAEGKVIKTQEKGKSLFQAVID